MALAPPPLDSALTSKDGRASPPLARWLHLLWEAVRQGGGGGGGGGGGDVAASDVSVSAITNLSATNAQAALAEHQADIDALVEDLAAAEASIADHETRLDVLEAGAEAVLLATVTEASFTASDATHYLTDVLATGDYRNVLVTVYAWGGTKDGAALTSQQFAYAFCDSLGTVLATGTAGSGGASYTRLIYFGAPQASGGPTIQDEIVGRPSHLQIGIVTTTGGEYVLSGRIEVWGLP